MYDGSEQRWLYNQPAEVRNRQEAADAAAAAEAIKAALLTKVMGPIQRNPMRISKSGPAPKVAQQQLSPDERQAANDAATAILTKALGGQ